MDGLPELSRGGAKKPALSVPPSNSRWMQTAPGTYHDLGPRVRLQPRQFLRQLIAVGCVPTAFRQLEG